MAIARETFAGQTGPGPTWPADGGRRRYSTPRLTLFGNLRGITLGGSPGPSDSGQNNMRDKVFFLEEYSSLP